MNKFIFIFILSLVLPAFAGSYDDDDEISGISGHTYFQGEIINSTCQLEINNRNINLLEGGDMNKSIKVEFNYNNCTMDSLNNFDFIFDKIKYELDDYEKVILSECDSGNENKQNDSCRKKNILTGRKQIVNGFTPLIAPFNYKRFIIRYDIENKSANIKGHSGVVSEFISNYQ